jgi:hypothetical protein
MTQFTFPRIFILLFFTLSLSAQTNYCGLKNNAFTAGEEITYELTYNWSNIPWTKVGYATFSVKEKVIKNKTYYHLIGTGSSYDSWDWFYKMRAIYQSYVDPVTLTPFYYKRDVQEPNYFIDLEYKYNWKDTLAYSKFQSKRTALRYDTIKIEPCTHDLIGVLYYARNIDYTKYKAGDVIPITLLIDREIFKIYYRYLGKEVLRVKNIGRYNTIKLGVYTVEGSMFQGGENMYIWITDDLNRVALQVETPIVVGSIKAFVSNMKGLKHPLTSKLK